MSDDGLAQLQESFDEAAPAAESTPRSVLVTSILFGGPLGGAIIGLIVATSGSSLMWTLLLGPWWVFVGALVGAIVAGLAVLVLFRLRRR